MLSEQDNNILTRVGRGMPMGELLRRYWFPGLLSSELPQPDSPPVRVRLLGEDLVAFRDSEGRVGVLSQACPHRGASLFFGRNEESGLRCVYHGWKFDVSGACVDMPSEPAESNFKSKVKARAYPTHESGGAVWLYMGAAESQPPFRDFGSDALKPEEQRASKIFSWCNFVQAMEGNLDTSHISYLHRNLNELSMTADETDLPGYPSVVMSTVIRGYDRAPGLEVEDTDYGYRYAGIRSTPAGYTHVRMSVFCLPIFTFVANLPSAGRGSGIFVPIDDHSCWRFNIAMSPGGLRQQPSGLRRPDFTDERGERLRRPENDYLIDREAQKTLSYTGIVGVGNQDYAVTESMGSIYDRRQEHLGTTDKAIIRLREQLIRAAKDLAAGIEPPRLENYPWQTIRGGEKILSQGEDWRLLGTDQEMPLEQWLAAGS
jgi:phthalate 4,5-dioxygenase